MLPLNRIYILYCLILLTAILPTSITQPINLPKVDANLNTNPTNLRTAAVSSSAVVNIKPLLSSAGTPNSEVAVFRNSITQQNINYIANNNANPKKSYELQANSFVTLSQNQMRQSYLTLIPSSPASIQLAKSLGKKKPIVGAAANMITTRSAFTNFGTGPTGSGTNIADTSPPTFAMSLTAGPTPQVSAASLQNNVLASVRKFFQNKNLSPDQINKTIQTYKYQGGDLQSIYVPPSSTTTSNTPPLPPPLRLLQQQQSSTSSSSTSSSSTSSSSTSSIYKSVDWSCLSGTVKAQGSCGACYAFTTVNNVASIFAIYYYTFYVELAIQEIIDCSQNSMTFGCSGGFMEGALSYMMDTGIYSDYTYPYTSYNVDNKDTKQGACKSVNKLVNRYKISDFQVVKSGDCENLKYHLQKHPISVAIAGYKLSFYKQGVFDGCDSNDVIDHAVLLVGWKDKVGWKIKNSWGPRWGTNGYGWVKDGNTCKICQVGFFPNPAGRGSDNYENNKNVKSCPAP